MSEETGVVENPAIESNGETEPSRKPKRSHKAKANQAGPKKSPGKSRGGRADVQKIRFREVSLVLKQAADPTRLHILMMLDGGEKNVREITDGIGTFSQPAVSHHIALLRHSRLISPRRAGKSNYYSLTEEGAALVGSLRGFVGA